MSEEAGPLGALFEVLSAAEADRVVARYAPLAEAVRNLVDAVVRTAADEDVVATVISAVESATRALQQRALPVGRSYCVDGRALPLCNAAVGVCNPIAPPLAVQRDGSGRYWADITLGAAYEGPPNLVHGGVNALVLDHMLNEAASEGLSKLRFTGKITLKYLRGTPLGRLRCEAWVDRVEGVKVFARGFISDADGVTAEAEGVFIEPAWAREGGNGQ